MSDQEAAWRPMAPATAAAGADDGPTEQMLYEVRRKIYPRAVTGAFARWRVWLVLATQAVFYGLPWFQWNGRQAVLFDLGARKFYLFGLVLWPQDVIYLTVLLVLSALGLFLFTAVAGRLFCGYACPQTVYTEIFMWIERRIEGDRFARIRLDGERWSLRKLRLKAAKHAAWLVIALWTGFTFVGFFTPIRELGMQVWTLSLGPWQTFWMLFYAFATWGNAGFMREQVCRYMCPYARFQSVMVDRDTYVVTYDTQRGEPRGSRSRHADFAAQGLGSCVDCSICVQVCPTGIDIRQGLQYECIGCGACIDACDQVMDKMRYPRGLIRYTSERAMLERLSPREARRHMLRPRVLVYATIMVALVAGFVAALAMRQPLKVDVIRDRGALAREVGGGKIENVYRLQLMNASEQPLHVTIAAEGLPQLDVQGARGESTTLVLPPAANRLLPVRVRRPADDTAPGSHKIQFVIHADNDSHSLVLREPSSFIVPR
ncbi:cytochrome c oxidase accessory protein CcoG [Ralstonia mannitolilytica]|uniref:cytochrome c oxidase accessory protein CcoG n=1 Tax=Ralstonia mannitolilytica TaxID=105219 RepID=UPI0028F5B029|nr:cytochrome c oxidase accessory protein CcoG [Ralstonia mannitolilytica]CAJ0742252.1 hypothetical protein R76696_03888 [Ralstonia mannitolilytica]